MMEQNIPLQNLTKQNAQIREELIADFVKVLDSGRYVSGPGVEKFENEFAHFIKNNPTTIDYSFKNIIDAQ